MRGRTGMVGLVRAIPLLALLALATPAAAQPAFTPRDERPEDYPAGEGRDQTFFTCTACHGFKIVAQQGQSRRQWDETLDWMTQRHNMPRLGDNDRKIVLDYLEASFPPRTAPRGFQNPFQNR
jgi:mono/diheme cytochrome c family protein